MGIKESTSPLLNESVETVLLEIISAAYSSNNYQSLQYYIFTIIVQDSYMEVQLRTKMMDDIAEIGSANHIGMKKSRNMNGPEEMQSRKESVCILMRLMREE